MTPTYDTKLTPDPRRSAFDEAGKPAPLVNTTKGAPLVNAQKATAGSPLTPRLPGGRYVRTAVGAYRQADLEAMPPGELRTIRGFALDRFNADLDGPDAEYWELLAGAAGDLLAARGEVAL